MPRTASISVKTRRDYIAKYVSQNHPVTFPEVLEWAIEEKLPALKVDDPQRCEYNIRHDLYKLRLDGGVKPSWVVQRKDW